ncbi:MAG: T9SS type A sorting domain-containing protein [Bacteroidales bacterium]
MKKGILSVIMVIISLMLMSQTATNFTTNDCKGTTYDLFTELAEGKVIILCWVMPCGPCVGPSLTTYNVAQSFQSTHPNKVKMYLCDDYADTPCPSLTSWANNYGLTQVTVFSDPAIKMEDYGTPGMPKIVVIAPDHTVMYNSNNTVDATALQSAIQNALMVTTSFETIHQETKLTVFPNPIRQKAIIEFNIQNASQVEIDLLSLEGAPIENIFSGWLHAGKNRIETQVNAMKPGVYLLQINDGNIKKLVKIVVAR